MKNGGNILVKRMPFQVTVFFWVAMIIFFGFFFYKVGSFKNSLEGWTDESSARMESYMNQNEDEELDDQ